VEVSNRWVNVAACAALVVAIIGLLGATWMPAIYAYRHPATQPATRPAE
jgi:hypothetical protein